MEASQPLSIESFSYSWVINIKPSFESFEAYDDAAAATFIEIDPKLTASKRFLTDSQDFANFDFPQIMSQSSPPLTLVHADELFSNGFLRPFFLKPSKRLESFNFNTCASSSSSSSHSVPSSPLFSSKSSKFLLPSSYRMHCAFISRCRRSSKRLLLKYLSFLRPLYQRAQPSSFNTTTSRATKTISTDESIGRVARRLGDSGQSSPLITINKAHSNGEDWCHMDNSISEAILHCKRSIEK